jgi:hypothetical protein
MLIVIGILIGLVAGGIAAVVAVRVLGATSIGAAQRERRLLLEQAERDAETTRRGASVKSHSSSVPTFFSGRVESSNRASMPKRA